ncbi:hypothetical protein T492DRAFT_1040985 [Pavlovales sp. CCMP2436]|nr:hypothetical protein T492DRAFT_1040985 [Pavlovales sp. CCMP2436]
MASAGSGALSSSCWIAARACCSGATRSWARSMAASSLGALSRWVHHAEPRPSTCRCVSGQAKTTRQHISSTPRSASAPAVGSAGGPRVRGVGGEGRALGGEPIGSTGSCGLSRCGEAGGERSSEGGSKHASNSSGASENSLARSARVPRRPHAPDGEDECAESSGAIDRTVALPSDEPAAKKCGDRDGVARETGAAPGSPLGRRGGLPTVASAVRIASPPIATSN